MKTSLRRVALVGAPVLAAALNFRHPVMGPPIYAGVSRHWPWWLVLHLCNLALFPLLGLAVYLLTAGSRSAAAAVSRVAIAVFVPVYAAFDALAGIGTGVLVGLARHLPPDRLAAVAPVLDAYWGSGVLFALAVIGSMAWMAALLSAAVALTAAAVRRRAALAAAVVFVAAFVARGTLFFAADGMSIRPVWWLAMLGLAAGLGAACRPRAPAVLLGLAAGLFGAQHVPPTGPLGLLCFAAAAAYVELQRHEPALHLARVESIAS